MVLGPETISKAVALSEQLFEEQSLRSAFGCDGFLSLASSLELAYL